MENHPLNALCPYYTMYPLSYPMRQLAREEQGGWVFDPFCGRGTTAFAAMMHGLNVVSVDVNPVATAITRAKSSNAKPHEIVNFARVLINEQEAVDLPKGEYWRHAYKPKVLRQICSIREGLQGQTDETSNALRGVMLGCLHGPIQGSPSYFSNQMQRTFSPKQKYAVEYWKRNALKAPAIDVFDDQVRDADKIIGYLANDAFDSFPIADFPMSIQRAHEAAKLNDFDAEFLNSSLMNAVESVLKNEYGERAPEVMNLIRLLGDPDSARY